MGNVNECYAPSGTASAGAAKAYFAFVAVFASILTVVGCVLLFMRRNVQVLRVRRPWTVIMTLVSFCAVTIGACIKEIAFVDSNKGLTLSCSGYWFSYSILNSITFSGLVVRGWIVIFMFNLNRGYVTLSRRRTTVKEDGEIAPEEPVSQKGKSWYFDNSKLLKSRFMLLMVIGVAALLLVAIGIYFAWKPAGAAAGATTTTLLPAGVKVGEAFECGCMSDHGSFIFVDLPIGCFLVGATVLLLRGLSNVTENFFLKEEMINLAKLVIGTGAFQVLLFTLLKKITEKKDPIITAALYITGRFLVPMIVLWWFTVGNTIQLTYRWEKVEDDRKVEENHVLSKLIPLKPTLNEMREEMFKMLFDDEGFQAFQNFLVKEFSVENILFWRDAKDFREFALQVENGVIKPSENLTLEGLHHKVDERGRKVFKDYCSDEAVLLINLPFAIHNRLKAVFAQGEVDTPLKRQQSRLRNSSQVATAANGQVEMSVKAKRRINSETFTDSMNEITNLMCSDSFRRFRMMDEYRDYILARYERDQGAGTVNLDLRGKMIQSAPETEL